MSWFEFSGDVVEIDCLAVPRSSRSRIAGIHDERLKVQLAAPPADGEANAALLELLTKLLGVKKSAVSLVAGHANRKKRVRVEGVSREAVEKLAQKG
jgi:uncharacterized protein (TIGR00251 family)